MRIEKWKGESLRGKVIQKENIVKTHAKCLLRQTSSLSTEKLN